MIRSVQLYKLLAISLLCAFAAIPSPAQRTHAPVRHAAPTRHVHPSQPSIDYAAKVNEALDALFVRSDLDAARAAAKTVITASEIKPGPQGRVRSILADALFADMEAAALQADTAAELDDAMRLCEIAGTTADPRAEIAAARLLDAAANTTTFRGIAPRLREALRHNNAQSSYLRAALLAAASDGMPGDSVLTLAHDSGLLTDWRVAGPFGRYPNVAFEKTWPPESDSLRRDHYADHHVERFQFAAGTFSLPDYFGTDGVFYASSEAVVPSAGNWILRVESAGTLELFVDDTRVLTKDDRLRATPEIVWQSVNLSAGIHRVAIKFLATAAPFRVALLPDRTSDTPAAPTIASAPEADYIRAALKYANGDYNSAIQDLGQLRSARDTAVVDYLLAQAWQHAGDNSVEQLAPLRDALRHAPSALAVETDLALAANSEDRADEAFERAHRVLQSRPDYEPALRLAATTASHLGWQAEAASSFEAVATLHPSCSVLQQASTFFTSIYDSARAQRYQSQLKNCAPGSLAYAQALSEAGRHADAEADALSASKAAPLDRDALALITREATLAGNASQARTAAAQLAALAPNSAKFRRLAREIAAGSPSLPDSRSDSFAAADQFYSPYRQDGLSLVQQTARRVFSGGPALTILNEQVARIAPDGRASVYVHTITRLLDRDGILQFGEVAIPHGADVLELRTIKSDLSVAEPEFNQHKDTISMPALAPGDAIDVEYVLHFDDGIDKHPDAFRYTFGSFTAPILFARFVVVSPDDAEPQFAPFGNVPTVRVQSAGNEVARVWERDDIPQSTPEIAMAHSGLLPEMQVLPAAPNGWADIRDFYRNTIITATRAGSRVDAFTREIQGETAEQKLRAAYRTVTSRIRATRADFASGEVPSAEDTLATYSGSRSAVLLAFAQAMGVRADLLMTRDAGSRPPSSFTPEAYDNPVLVFHLGTPDSPRDIVVDAEHEGIGFGAIAPTLERNDALVVPLHFRKSDDKRLIASVPAALLDDESVADGDVTFDEDGNLSASVSIRMGSARSAQMRAVLAGIEPAGRTHFFEQLAMRIFPGATEATGQVRNEFDADRPLELSFKCRAPHFTSFSSYSADIDQLVPALGLRKMYGSTLPRRTPLYLDTPLFEAATFRLHLPSSMRFSGVGTDVIEKNEFGTYSVTFRQDLPNTVTVRREFHIPVQIVSPERFAFFDQFMRTVDNAERQRLTVEKLARATAAAR